MSTFVAPEFVFRRIRRRGVRTIPRPAPVPHVLPKTPVPSVPPTAYMCVTMPTAQGNKDGGVDISNEEFHFFLFDGRDGSATDAEDVVHAPAPLPVLFVSASHMHDVQSKLEDVPTLRADRKSVV